VIIAERKGKLKHGPPLFRPGVPSTVARPIEEATATKAVLWIRESSRTQERNAIDQERDVREELNRRGIEVVGVCSHVGSGWFPQLHPAVQLAKEHNAVIVAETMCRVARPTDFHPSKNPNACLTNGDLHNIKWQLDGVPLYTINDPDATAGRNRSRQTKRGMHGKNRKGGRPIYQRLRFKQRWMPVVIKLSEKGCSYRETAKQVSKQAGRRISHVSIGKWIHECALSRGQSSFRLPACAMPSRNTNPFEAENGGGRKRGNRMNNGAEWVPQVSG
jgi:hypothetical protein